MTSPEPDDALPDEDDDTTPGAELGHQTWAVHLPEHDDDTDEASPTAAFDREPEPPPPVIPDPPRPEPTAPVEPAATQPPPILDQPDPRPPPPGQAQPPRPQQQPWQQPPGPQPTPWGPAEGYQAVPVQPMTTQEPLATGAVVVGLISAALAFCCWPAGLVLGVVAFALGVAGLVRIKESNGMLTGGELAMAGAVLGGAAILIGVGLNVFLLRGPFFF